jgi:hypothetical protein
VAIGGDADDTLVAVALAPPAADGGSGQTAPGEGYAVGATSGVMPRASCSAMATQAPARFLSGAVIAKTSASVRAWGRFTG